MYPVGPIKRVYCKLQTFRRSLQSYGRVYPRRQRLGRDDGRVCNGALGTIHTSRWVAGHANRLALKISGTKGTVDIDSERSTTAYRICTGADVDTCTWKDIEAKPVRTSMSGSLAAR